jgi:predicted adenine nucleotide alpha hydrolase (AANH) superfamily ATPase
MKKLLMHICCANCSIYPLQNLLEQGFLIRGYWLNPNIHPYLEYKNRLESVHKLQKLLDLDIEYDDHYGLKEFLRTVVHDEDNRCAHCYSIRMEQTAQTARKMGLDGFTTSHLVSPYQKFDMIKDIGNELGKRYAIKFYCSDFRPGWKKTMQRSKKLGLYRQKYCGCIFSEMERYLKKE